MNYIHGEDRNQMRIESLESFASPDSEVRVIDKIVDAMDIESLGFKLGNNKDSGRPKFDPKDLLKLYIYGYFNGIRSSRKLAKQCVINKEVIWLIKDIKPKYRVIADFRKDNIDDMAAILILKLSNCCKLNHKYKEALEFCKLPLKNESFISMDIKLELLLNKAEILMLLKEYDSSLDEIESIEEFNEELSEEYLFTLNMLKGQCYRENRYYRDALEVYKSLKEGAGSLDKSKILCININIIGIYILLRDNRNIRKHIDESLVLISSNRQLYKEKRGAEIFSGLAKGFKFISEDERAAEYYNHAIYSAKRNKQYEILTDALENLFEIFEKKKALHEVDNIKNELLELISTNAINNDNTLIFKVIGFYNAMDDKESIEGIVSFILNHQ